MDSPENNLITVFTAKEITSLYKLFLELLEDLEKDNEIMLKKVASQTNDQFVSEINFFTPEKYEQLRKRVLDQGNETSRKLLSFIEFFDFNINPKRVEEAAKQKRAIIKKVVISPHTHIQ